MSRPPPTYRPSRYPDEKPGHHHIRWREVVHSYPCPLCTAGPGDWCVTSTGFRKYEPHSDRARLAAANNWQFPSERP